MDICVTGSLVSDFSKLIDLIEHMDWLELGSRHNAFKRLEN